MASGEHIYWDEVPAPDTGTSPLPATCDVAIIGAGYTGLSTALHLARAGRHVVVLEAGGIGAGASSRNGGMVGPSFHKLGSAGLQARYGADKTLAIMREGMNALDHFEQFVAAEQIECDLQMCGRFRGARTVADYDATARECEWLNSNLGLPFEMIPKAAQYREIGSDFYQGGVVYSRDGGIHPRKLVVGLAKRALEAGVQIVPHCPVTAIQRESTGTALQTSQGVLSAADLVMATNGWSDRRTPQVHNRIIAIPTAGVATQELPTQMMANLTPKGRMMGESGRVFMWFRPTPDGKRFIFGGRIGTPGGPIAKQQRAFAASARRVFPQLAEVEFSHVWSGNVAYTADHSPHLGKIDGVWFAGGYCGSGVTRSLYFGMKLARKILGQKGAETAFDDLPFPRVPFKPFSAQAAALMTKYYSYLDARDLRRAGRQP